MVTGDGREFASGIMSRNETSCSSGKLLNPFLIFNFSLLLQLPKKTSSLLSLFTQPPVKNWSPFSKPTCDPSSTLFLKRDW